MPINAARPTGQLRLSLGAEREIFGVSELNAAVQQLFTDAFTRVWVSGEISGCRVAGSGHYYFSLKDADAQVRCVLFKGVGRLTRVKPQDGLAVVVQGNLEVYQARGEYQLIVERIEPHGAGSLQAAFEQLKTRLAEEGLFSSERKTLLPKIPRRIGLITSSTGSVLQDMLHVLNRRFPGLHIRLYPAQVQGEGSVEQLCAAVHHFNRHAWAEVVIIARGGGSLEDLWGFNDERLARAIAESGVPIISAVGHETDFTICDFVADHRAPTPSAAAEIVICTRESLLLQLSGGGARLLRSLRYRLLVLSREVEGRLGDRGTSLIRRGIRVRMQQLDDADQQIRTLQGRRLELLTRQLSNVSRRLQDSNLLLRFSRIRRREEVLTERLAKGWRTAYWRMRQRLDVASSHAVQLSPLEVLARGYAIVETPSGQILRSAGETSANQELSVRLYAGRITVIVATTETG